MSENQNKFGPKVYTKEGKTLEEVLIDEIDSLHWNADYLRNSIIRLSAGLTVSVLLNFVLALWLVSEFFK